MSQTGVTSRNHPLYRREVDDRTDDRRTPDEIFAPFNAEHGFTLDAAASEQNAKCRRFYTRETDGLTHSWRGERVWCNPPYSFLGPWVAKAWLEMRTGCEVIVMLLPANRCEQPFWQEHVEPFRDNGLREGIRLAAHFLPGRPRFGVPVLEGAKTPGDRPPFGNVALVWTRAA